MSFNFQQPLPVAIVVKSEKPDHTSLGAISLTASLNARADDDAIDDDCGDFENELADPAASAFNEMEDEFEGMLR